MCPHCADGADPDLARRQRVLQLLALIEHSTALPAEAALRIAHELLAWTAPANSTAKMDSRCQCNHVVATEPRLEAVA